ncbi:MAG: SDR family NAD(P)-dependent oxidoreductase [Saprospiraceae bacterium]|nr:SDR family NAD(P)-dependent oxidoreductase [Saprospiraceae bacterium]
MQKKALVTGASKGIGRALCELLLANGFEVHGTSRDGRMKGLTNSQMFMYALDLSKVDIIEAFHKQLQTKGLPFDLVINNAGIGPDLNTFEPKADTLRSTLAVNVEGTILHTELVLPMIRKGGMLLNISSKMGSIASCVGTDSIAYRISKSALNMYGKILTNRHKEDIRIATIHPGWVRTEITADNIHARLSPEESASRIWSFMQQDFQSGTYWDAERGEGLPW